MFKDVAENPAVPVEVGELGALELWIDVVANRSEEFYAAPLASKCRLFGVPHQNLLFLSRGWFLVSFFAGLRVHVLAVGFQIPPGRAVVTHQHQSTRMHVTNNALARGYSSRELMLDRMPRLFAVARFPQSRIPGLRSAIVSKLCVRSRVKLIAIIGVDHVAGRAAARPIVSRLLVRAE